MYQKIVIILNCQCRNDSYVTVIFTVDLKPKRNVCKIQISNIYNQNNKTQKLDGISIFFITQYQ